MAKVTEVTAVSDECNGKSSKADSKIFTTSGSSQATSDETQGSRSSIYSLLLRQYKKSGTWPGPLILYFTYVGTVFSYRIIMT